MDAFYAGGVILILWTLCRIVFLLEKIWGKMSEVTIFKANIKIKSQDDEADWWKQSTQE